MSQDVQKSVIPTKILVPVDFSPSSHQALDAAAEHAAKFNATVIMLHVIPEYANAVLPQSVTPESLVEAEKEAANDRFEVSKSVLDGNKIACTAMVEVGTDVVSTILDIAEQENVDLLVFTTHGLSGWYPQVFGSIAEKLVKLAQCPVLLLRATKPESSAKVAGSRMMEWW